MKRLTWVFTSIFLVGIFWIILSRHSVESGALPVPKDGDESDDDANNGDDEKGSAAVAGKGSGLGAVAPQPKGKVTSKAAEDEGGDKEDENGKDGGGGEKKKGGEGDDKDEGEGEGKEKGGDGEGGSDGGDKKKCPPKKKGDDDEDGGDDKKNGEDADGDEGKGGDEGEGGDEGKKECDEDDDEDADEDGTDDEPDSDIGDKYDNTGTYFSYDFNPTIIRFTYDDNHEKGPKFWSELPGTKYRGSEVTTTTNRCGIWYKSPLAIQYNQSMFVEREGDEDLLETQKPSIVFRHHPGIENDAYILDYPKDFYHGIEVRPAALGNFHIFDEYNTQHRKDVHRSMQYDFSFATITYCDYSTVPESAGRSSHTLEGEKFPLEIHMLFFYKPLDYGLDHSLRKYGPNYDNYVMVSIVGRLSKHDNPSLEPIIEAAGKFSGGGFDDFEDAGVKLTSKFSPTWLIPRGVGYYYYMAGSFPVPPCFNVPRVYVLKEPIYLSARQLEVLKNIKSAREPSGKLSCTMGVLQSKIGMGDVQFNPFPLKLDDGIDNRPRDPMKSGVERFRSWIEISSVMMMILSTHCSLIVSNLNE